jgi:KRAB domain-containing zinc finger protein
MSKKISDFFKTQPKFNLNSKSNQEVPRTTTEIKHEKEAYYEINLDAVKLEIRECRVVVKDINKKNIKKEPKKSTKTSNQRIVECEICSKKVQRGGLQSHLKAIHSEVMKGFPFGCQFCDLRFLETTSLNRHTVKAHPEESNSVEVPKARFFQCDYDGKIFETRSKFLSHIFVHKSKEKCEFCDQMYITNQLKHHILSVHAKSGEFQCKICQKSFKILKSLKTHLKLHNKKFKCTTCSKMFGSKGTLNEHIRNKHKNRESFQCETCDKKFNIKQNLQKHQKTHDRNRPKPYKCQRCIYSTDNPCHLKIHQKFHENQDKKIAAMKNPLKCQKCSKYCKDKKAFLHHMNQVHSKVKFQCDLCGKYFGTKSSLKFHIECRTCQKNKN